jgi:hypothetical protein
LLSETRRKVVAGLGVLFVALVVALAAVIPYRPILVEGPVVESTPLLLAAAIAKPMRLPGFQAQNTSSRRTPPITVTVRVVPSPKGWGLVHSTFRITGKNSHHVGPSSRSAKRCAAETGNSRLATECAWVRRRRSSPAGSSGYIFISDLLGGGCNR